MKLMGFTGFRGLWALKWAWQTFSSFSRFVGVRVGVANFFLGQSIGIDEITFQLKLALF